jgi:hypothetical protein
MIGGSTTSLDEALDEAHVYRACRAGELTATKHVVAPRYSLLHDDNDNPSPQAEASRKAAVHGPMNLFRMAEPFLRRMQKDLCELT